MERYFEVTQQSTLYNEYMNYKENQNELHKLSVLFLNSQGVETAIYANQGNNFYIVPTDKDLEKFSKSLCKPLANDLRAFKTNSKIGKAWVKLLEEKQFKVVNKPYVGFSFMNCLGKNRSRIFAIDDRVYCSFENEYDFEDTPEGFVELKASEFWKIIEDEDKRRKSNEQ